MSEKKLSDEHDPLAQEWASMNEKHGGGKARSRTLLSGATFLVVFLAVFLGLGSVLATREEEENAALAAQGLRRVYVGRGGRSVSEGERTSGSFLLLFAAGGAAGLVAGGAVFFAMGGKLSAEHIRGLKNM